MNKIIWVIVLIVIILGAYLIWGGKGDPIAHPIPTPTIDQMPAALAVIDTPVVAPSVKEFVVDGSNYQFSVAEMRVNVGDMVRVVYTNKGGMHDWKIDEFAAATKKLEVDQSETIEFVADKAGTFEYYCSVGQHRQAGMVGKLIVE